MKNETITTKFVAVTIDGETQIHARGSGTYATLCCLDGDDEGAGQKPAKLPRNPKIDCPQCFDIWTTVQMFSSNDFAQKCFE